MKTYLTSLFSFLFFFFLYTSLFAFFFWCRVLPTVKFYFVLGTSSNHFLFSGSSHGQSTNKIVTQFLSFPNELAREDRLLFVSQIRLPLRGSVGQLSCLIFFFFADSTYPLFRITWDSWPLNRSLVARG